MDSNDFLTEVCPNHTDKSQWNKSELLHILDLHKRQLLLSFARYTEGMVTFNGISEEDVEDYLNRYKT